MNSRCLVICLNLFFIRTIFGQLYLQQRNSVGQNSPTNPPLPNVNNLPLVNNFPAANSFQLLNSLAVDSNSPVNRLQILAGLPFFNGLGSDNLNNNAISQSNILRIGNELPAANNAAISNVLNNLPGNNILANNNLPNCNLPVSSNPSNLQVNNLPVIPNIPTVELPFGNTVHGLANNRILTTNPVAFTNGGQSNIGMTNLQNFNNFLHNAPKVTKNTLPAGILPKSGLPVLNTNLLNSLLENNAVMNSKPASPALMNHNLQFASPLANCVPGNNGLSNVWSGSDGLPLSQQTPVNFQVNFPTSIPIPNNLLGPSVPTNGPLNSLTMSNFNNIQTDTYQQAPNNMQPHVNNVLQLSNIPTANNVETCQNSLNFPVSNVVANNLPVSNLVPNTLPVSNVVANNLPVSNLIHNTLSGINLLANNLPVNNLMGNLPGSNIGQYLPVGSNVNIPSSLSSINLLNLGELGNLPILSGLPVIGITETITVINTAPSLIL